MKYGMRLSGEVLQTLRAMPKEQRRAIGHRLHLLSEDLSGDVKKLAAALPAYRLRVGNFRVLFTLENQMISIFAIKNRKTRMSEPLTLEVLAQTVERQAAELDRLSERVEDLEDLNDLQEAIARNAGQPLHSWQEVREELGLTDEELTRPAIESR